jgi:hypothetical protein
MEFKVDRKIYVLDSSINSLLERSKAGIEASEDDVRSLLRRYSVKDALLGFGELSRKLFFDNNLSGRQNASMLIEPETGLVVTQFALAYLSSMAILSGSNDYKIPIVVSGRGNIEGMCNIYSNALSTPMFEQEIEKYGPAPFLIRMATEQFSYQISGSHMLARTSVMFLEIASGLQPRTIRNLNDVFQDSTGLSLSDSIWLSFCFFALLQQRSSVRESQLLDAIVPVQYKSLLTAEKIEKFIGLMCLDYSKFREIDNIMNGKILSPHTKTRFNPLIQYPIIKLQTPDGTNPYVIPNVITYLRRITDGLYWWFDSQFTQEGESTRNEYRKYFGEIFEIYVGRVLGAIYGEKNIQREFQYGLRGEKKLFIDWWMLSGDKLYLFEAKANQVNLFNRSVCDPEKYKQEEIPKIAKAIKQLFLRVKDIQSGDYQELHQFQGKSIIPIAVFLDMPFVAEKGLYRDAGSNFFHRSEQ